MDAVTAFSVACGVIQVIHFCSNIITHVQEVYEYGASAETATLEAAGLSLQSSTESLQQSIMKLPQPQSKNEQDLQNIAGQCLATSKDLLKKLERLRPTSNKKKGQALRKAFKAVWEQGDVKMLYERLEKCRRALDTGILVSLSQRLDLLVIQQESGFAMLDAVNRKTITDIWKCSSVVIDASEAAHKLTRLRFLQQLEEERHKRADEEHYQKVLHSLHFQTINSRQQQIIDNEKNTFRWIFDEVENGTKPWANFVSWLQEAHGIYWISGKAGSGKSTLMNYISGERATQRALEVWSGAEELLIVRFFFWNGGSAEQKSLFGLLCSINYQILEAYPQLIKVVSDQVLDTGESRQKAFPIWSRKRLVSLLRHLVQSTIIHLKFCFFIDGLDEFEDSQEDADHLVDVLRDLTQYSNVKMCLSSRPLRTFEMAFAKCPMLRLQDLTHEDMKLYVNNQFLRYPETKTFMLTQSQDYRLLIKDLLSKSDGVFLWTTLVTRDLIHGIKNEDAVTELFDRIDKTPSDLENLYVTMLAGLDKTYLEDALLQFWLMITAYRWRGASLLDLAFGTATSNGRELKYLRSLREDPPANRGRKIATLRTKIIARGAGLLEIHMPKAYNHDSPEFDDKIFIIRVEFVHRTVQEFLTRTQHGRKFMRFSEMNQVHACHTHSLLALEELKLLPSGRRLCIMHSRATNRIFIYARICELISGTAQVQLMQRIKDDLVALINVRKSEGNECFFEGWRDCFDHTPSYSGDKDFFNLCAAYGIHLYVIYMIDSVKEQHSSLSATNILNDTVRSSHGVCIHHEAALLAQTVHTYPELYRNVQDNYCKMVTKLLKCGANPNHRGSYLSKEKPEHYRHTLVLKLPAVPFSVWHIFLGDMWEMKHHYAPSWIEHSWLHAVSTFLENGADITGIIQLYTITEPYQFRHEANISFILQNCLENDSLEALQRMVPALASDPTLELVEIARAKKDDEYNNMPVFDSNTTTFSWSRTNYSVKDVRGNSLAACITQTWLQAHKFSAAKLIYQREKNYLDHVSRKSRHDK